MALIGSTSSTERSTIRSGVTKTDVGLGSVDNESKSTMFSSPTFTGTVELPSATNFNGEGMVHATCTTGTLQNASGIACRKWIRTFNSGSSSVTHDVMKLARWWWGEGCMLIYTMEWYYGPNSEWRLDKFVGTTRPGYSPSFSNIISSGGPGPFCTNHNTSAENVDVKITTGSYRRAVCVIEVYGMNYLSNAGDVGAGNEYHPYSFVELV
jgi:hypothetical protein